MKITTIGLDIEKSVFHLFAMSKTGRLVKKKQLKRSQILLFIANKVLIALPCSVLLSIQSTL